MNDVLDRAMGCLAGGAIGDAMGMPASFLSQAQIRKTYGYIEDFLPPAPGAKAHLELGEGETTDDTYETMIVARVLIEKGRFDAPTFGRLMKDWALEKNMLESDLIGPSTRRFLTALIEGRDPSEGAGEGDTNGSAMRAAPLGIFYHGDLEACRREALKSSQPSHGSASACAACCAVATACAMGVHGGYGLAQILEEAARAAQYGEEKGTDLPSPLISMRLRCIKKIVDEMEMEGRPLMDIISVLTGVFGAGMKAYESVPFALGIFYASKGDPRVGIPAAVNGGDDADTNGSICGALCGAYRGLAAIPEKWLAQLENGSAGILQLARELIQARPAGLEAGKAPAQPADGGWVQPAGDS